MRFVLICLMLIILVIVYDTGSITAMESNTPKNTSKNGASASELKALMIDSVKNLSTYRSAINTMQQIHWKSENPDNDSKITQTSLVEEAINLTAHEISVTRKVNLISGSGNITPEENDYAIYVINGTLYAKNDSNWVQYEIRDSEALLNQMNRMENLTNQLNDSEIKLLGFESVDGEECYVVSVKPDTKTYNTMLSQQITPFLYEASINQTLLFERTNVEWTSWITEDTHILKKNEITTNFTFNPKIQDKLKNVDENSWVNITTASTTLFKDLNATILITPSDDIKSAYPFPLKGSNGNMEVTVFGLVRDGTSSDYLSDYRQSTDNIYLDMEATGRITAELVDTDDIFHKPSGYQDSLQSNERAFLKFNIPKGTIIKKLRIEPDSSYSEEKWPPFSLDLRMDRLGSFVQASHKWKEGSEVSENNIMLKLYGITQESQGTDSHLMNFALDLKVTNNGTAELPLDSQDFGLIDQFGWEYKAERNYRNELSSLVPGESRRFEVTIKGLSELSDIKFLKYKDIRMNI